MVATHRRVLQMQVTTAAAADASLRSEQLCHSADLGTVDDLPELSDLAKDGDAGVRRAAAAAIGRLGTAADVVLLRDLAKDSDTFVRDATRHAIEAMHARGLLGAPLVSLRDFLLDADPKVSSMAAGFVGRFCKRETILRFLTDHQHEMTTEALGTLDWYLHAPAFLREANERKQDE